MQSPDQLLSEVEVLSLAAAGVQTDSQSMQVEQEAIKLASQQPGVLGPVEVAQRYRDGLAAAVADKVEQVGRLEVRLESQIELQASRLQSMESNRPGLFSRPRTRDAWRAQQQQQQQVMLRLQNRLETVREIRDEVGVNGPRLHEMAEQLNRLRDPDLAQRWDDLMAAQRGHVALQRKQWQASLRQRKGVPGLSLSRSLSKE